MPGKVRRAFLCSVWLILFALGNGFTPVRGEDGRYFPETGHRVTGDFYDEYMAASDPEAIYGYPITDAFQNPSTGLIVQYFQRAHFELHPENPPQLRITITLLGTLFYTPGKALNIPKGFSACLYFAETDHQICYAFRDFFEANGGVVQFGYPISEIEIQDGRMVQYFQRACFEWHPELPSGRRVKLADLGMRYFVLRKEDSIRLLPNRESYTNQVILKLQAHAFPMYSVVAPYAGQRIYVVVQDQNLLPVASAQVELLCVTPRGKKSP